MRTRVAVVGGGQSCEHEVSLASAASVAAALDPAAYEVERLTIAEDGRWLHEGAEVGLAQGVRLLQSCAVVLPIVHGPRGEDGSLAALCELAGVPYVGSGVRAGALAMDKWATKLVAEAVGVGTAPGCLLTRDAALDGRPWTGPVVVKPVAAGSSHGVTLVRTPAELVPALELAFSLDERVLVEDLLVGREIDVAVLTLADGSRLVGPPLEIVVDAGALFDTGRKYDGSADFRLPADVDDVLRKELETAATTMYDALGCAGLARIDFFMTAEGLVLNEVNTMPGMTEQSQAPKMFAAAGLAYADLLDELVRGALARAAPVVPFTV
jgi:D-alanine-D-alanine ligase